MWGAFFIACIAGAAFLLLPGYLFARSATVARLASFAVAPCISSCAYAVAGIAFSAAGISCSWQSAFGAAALVAAACFAVRAVAARGVPERGFTAGAGKRLAPMLGLYLLCGFAVAVYLFLSVLDSPEAFSQEFDALFHTGLVRSFLDTGNWSSFAASLYDDPLNPYVNPAPGIGAYPASWHCLVALVADAAGVSVNLAANAVNTLFMAAVFPSGMFLLMHVLFPDDRRAVVAGAVATVAFTSFPYRLLWWGPLYPSLASFAFMPAVMACFIALTSRGFSKAERLPLAVSVFVGGVSMVLMQPSAVFAMIVFLLPHCVSRVFEETRARGNARLSSDSDRTGSRPPREARTRRAGVLRPALAAAGFAAAVAVFWTAVYFAYPDRDAIEFTWKAMYPLPEAIKRILLVDYCQCPYQVVLALSIAVGIVRAARVRGRRRLIASYALMCAILAICLGTEWPLKHVLGGFWYTDQMRLAALAAMFAMPLAALGFQGLCLFARWVAARLSGNGQRGEKACDAAAAVMAVLIVAGVFIPYVPWKKADGGWEETAAGCMRNTLAWTFNYHETWYLTEEESAFLQRVSEEYPDARFINNPFDGSCWAFPCYDMKVYFRSFDIYGFKAESETSVLIRTSLAQIASRTDVQDAVRGMQAGYVIRLDGNPDAPDVLNQWMYKPDQWMGVDAIDAQTPGFQLVMQEGDMALYRISCLD